MVETLFDRERATNTRQSLGAQVIAEYRKHGEGTELVCSSGGNAGEAPLSLLHRSRMLNISSHQVWLAHIRRECWVSSELMAFASLMSRWPTPLLRSRCTVFVPTSTSSVMVRRLRELDAEVVQGGAAWDDADKAARKGVASNPKA